MKSMHMKNAAAAKNTTAAIIPPDNLAPAFLPLIGMR